MRAESRSEALLDPREGPSWRNVACCLPGNGIAAVWGDCVLTGVLADRSALFGILAQIEALGLELIEIRRLVPNPEQADRKG